MFVPNFIFLLFIYFLFLLSTYFLFLFFYLISISVFYLFSISAFYLFSVFVICDFLFAIFYLIQLKNGLIVWFDVVKIVRFSVNLMLSSHEQTKASDKKIKYKSKSAFQAQFTTFENAQEKTFGIEYFMESNDMQLHVHQVNSISISITEKLNFQCNRNCSLTNLTS